MCVFMEDLTFLIHHGVFENIGFHCQSLNFQEYPFLYATLINDRLIQGCLYPMTGAERLASAVRHAGHLPSWVDRESGAADNWLCPSCPCPLHKQRDASHYKQCTCHDFSSHTIQYSGIQPHQNNTKQQWEMFLLAKFWNLMKTQVLIHDKAIFKLQTAARFSL